MNEKPIIFSSEMVRAIFAGKKKQTRRVVKGWESIIEHVEPCYHLLIRQHGVGSENFTLYSGSLGWINAEEITRLKSPWKVGQRLWVREKCQPTDFAMIDGAIQPRSYLYAADEMCESDYRWDSPLFMRKEASRIKLEVTNIRLERLTDISASDIISEGFDVDSVESDCVDDPWGHWWHVEQAFFRHVSRVNHQHDDWATETNPLVWVIDFETVSIKGNAVKSSVNADCGA